MKEYLNFDLQLEYDGQDYRCRVLDSPVGQAHEPFYLPFSSAELAAVQSVAQAGSGPDIDLFGNQLFDALFQGGVREALRRSMDAADNVDAGLRINLLLNDVPELAGLPWEMLRDSTHERYLVLSERTPLVRYLALPLPEPTLRVNPPLRVLACIANPDEESLRLDAEKEWQNLHDALADIAKAGLVVLERVEPPTLSALQNRLREGDVHVFHFIGHGVFDEEARSGQLLFTDDTGAAQPVAASTLSTLLHNHRPLRLALLNACEGGIAANDSPFTGVAQSLVQQGIPAVIAMQAEISDSSAIAFAREFYRAIADGYPVDAAMTEGRVAIYTNGSEEWKTPVLFSRSNDNRLFALPQSEQSVSAVVEPGKPAAGSSGRQIPRIALAAGGALALLLLVWVAFRLWPFGPANPAATPTQETANSAKQATATQADTASSVVPAQVEPTATPTPESSAILSPTLAPADQVSANLASHVIITELDSTNATRRFAFSRRLEQDLLQRLDEYGLSNVDVVVSPNVISSASEARQLASDQAGRAVIWGWYDDLDVGIRIELLEETQADNLSTLTQLPLLQSDEGEQQLAVVVREVLPQNVSFLSLFVIGHLSYLANDYPTGHRAFDAAMEAMPAEAQLENPALVHFFSARQLENAVETETIITAICGYVDAIEADPTFAPAYNNLANLISRHFVPARNQEFIPIPEEVTGCLERIDIADRSVAQIPIRIYDLALTAQPGWSLADYNRVSYIWNQSYRLMCTPGGEYYCLHDAQELIEPLQEVLDVESSFIGAYVVLGNLAFEKGEYANAQEQYETALGLTPTDSRIRFNLAQTLAQLGRRDASALNTEILAEDSSIYEATLALAAQAYREESWEEAQGILEQIPPPDENTDLRSAPEMMATFMRSALAYRTGEPDVALDELERLMTLTDDGAGSRFWPIEQTLLGYITYLKFLLAEPQSDADEKLMTLLLENDPASIWVESFYRVQNASIGLAWYQLGEECTPSVAESDCLAGDIDGRIVQLYDRVVANFPERLYYARGDLGVDHVNLGAACPYVYSVDPATAEWVRDTTILYLLVGPEEEKLQYRPLRNFDGRLLIREEEPEISYIDRLFVLVQDRSGQTIRLEASGVSAGTLSTADDHYLVMHPGDEVALHFPDYDPLQHIGPVQIVAEGYYIPLH